MQPCAMAVRLVACLAAAGLWPAAHGGQLPDYGMAPAGFYQLVVHEGEVLAAFGGTLENAMAEPVTYPLGVTPGAVFVLDADTMALRREVPLRSVGGALALNPAKRQLIVGHTHDHAISVVDLPTGAVRHRVLDTSLDGGDYRIRYVATDSQGAIYVSAFDWRIPFRHAVFKFDDQGRRVPEYRLQSFDGFSIALEITRSFSADGSEQVLSGSSVIRLADARTGGVAYTSSVPVKAAAQEQTNFYRYIPGPGGSLIATNHPHWMDGNQGDANLYLFEKGQEGQPQKLFTASTALEAVYDAPAGRLYATSYGNRLLSIVSLADGQALLGATFENIRFAGGTPNSLAMRKTARGTELFITLRDGSHGIARVTIAPGVRGIDGLRAPGACTVQSWDLATRAVTPASPCLFMDVAQQLRENLAGAEAFARDAPGQVAGARTGLEVAREALREAEAAHRARPADPVAAQALAMARVNAGMGAFMLEAFQRAAQGAAHAVEGARRFLEAHAAQ